MSVFEKNLEVLHKRDPQLADAVASCRVSSDLTVTEARSGQKVPVVAGRALHSTYRPADEGSRFITAQSLQRCKAVVVLGLGFGYHLDALAGIGIPVTIVERRLDILRAAMEARDLEPVLATAKLFCAAAPASVAASDSVADAIDAGALAVLSHEPCHRLAPDYYTAVREALQKTVPESRGQRLRILVVSPAFGGSLPIARYAVRGLEQNGCETLFLDISPFGGALRYLDDSLKNTTVQAGMTELFQRFLCEFVYWKVKQLQPDLVFFIAQAPVSKELLNKLHSENYQTGFWFVENFKTFPYWKEIAPHCDYFFAIQRSEFFDRLDELKTFHRFYLPAACDPSVHRPETLTAEEVYRYGCEISMAGFGYFNRLRVLQGLTDFRLKLWGPGWEGCRELAPFVQNGAEFDSETAVKIYNASLVNLNLHSSTHAEGIEREGDLVNPRTFELAGCGAFQLTDERQELPPLFSNSSEIVTFRDIAGLRGKVEYYLAHKAERLEIAARARARALAEHTYAMRMGQMLRAIYPARWLRKRTMPLDDSDRRERLLLEMPPEHDLLPVVKACPDERITVDSLIRRLESDSAAPGPSEIALRWMRHTISQGLRR